MQNNLKVWKDFDFETKGKLKLRLKKSNCAKSPLTISSFS